jgi:hypothetical protein
MHILDRLRVVSEDAKIVNGIAVHGVAVDFFVVVKDAMSPERAGADNVAIRQDVAKSNSMLVIVHQISY